MVLSRVYLEVMPNICDIVNICGDPFRYSHYVLACVYMYILGASLYREK